MKFKVANRKWLLVIGVALIAAIGTVFISGILRDSGPKQGSQEYLSQALDNEDTKKDLNEGNCSEETLNKLSSIDEAADADVVARAYETRALCLAFADKNSEAAEAYEKASEFYEKAGDTEMAETMGSLAENNRNVLPIGPVDNLPEEQAEEGLEYVAQ